MHTKPTAPKPPAITLPRAIRTHECTEADKLLTIHAGPDREGGAPDHYEITTPVLDQHGRSCGTARTALNFQRGPICENGLNGITIESLLAIAEDRLERFQQGPHPCAENDNALYWIRQAKTNLHARTRRRQREHTEGTSQVAPVSDRCAPPPSPPDENQSGEGRGEGSPGTVATAPPSSRPSGVPGSERSEGPAGSPDHLTLRPSVAAFAQEMERTLRKHDTAKGGQPKWRASNLQQLNNFAGDEITEIDEAIEKDQILHAAQEAIDAANFCMMIWDSVCGGPAEDPDPNADQPAEGGAS